MPPFGYYGGKRDIAAVVWDRFGDVSNYVEPFAGGLAVLLGRPNVKGAETVNDLNCFIANFWRAVKFDPKCVYRYLDYPNSHVDLISRHNWLVDRKSELAIKITKDPDYFDAKIAGWWVWGISVWPGGGWCDRKNSSNGTRLRKPRFGVHANQGVQSIKFTMDSINMLSCRLRRVTTLML